MIQPIGAFSPRAGFRGSNGTYGKKNQRTVSSNIALLNAGGVALVAGGITTAFARSYTSSWAHAGVLGLCGSLLAMFFMTPHLIDKTNKNKMNKNAEPDIRVKDEAQKVSEALRERLKPAKKLVQFKQS